MKRRIFIRGCFGRSALVALAICRSMGLYFFLFFLFLNVFKEQDLIIFGNTIFWGKEFSVLLSAWVPKVFMRAFSMWSAEALATLSIGTIMKFIAEAR